MTWKEVSEKNRVGRQKREWYPFGYYVGGTSGSARMRRTGTRVGGGVRVAEMQGGAIRWYEVTSRRVDTHSYYNPLPRVRRHGNLPVMAHARLLPLTCRHSYSPLSAASRHISHHGVGEDVRQGWLGVLLLPQGNPRVLFLSRFPSISLSLIHARLLILHLSHLIVLSLSLSLSLSFSLSFSHSVALLPSPDTYRLRAPFHPARRSRETGKRPAEALARGSGQGRRLPRCYPATTRARMGPPRQGGATAFAWQGETERRKEKTEHGARGWWAAGRKGGQELQEPAPPANERGCKSAAAAWMSLLSLCDRMCGTAAWLVPVTCLRGVRSHLLCTLSRPGITLASDPAVRRQVDELARGARGWRFEVPCQEVLISSGRIVIPLIIAYPVSQSWAIFENIYAYSLGAVL